MSPRAALCGHLAAAALIVAAGQVVSIQAAHAENGEPPVVGDAAPVVARYGPDGLDPQKPSEHAPFTTRLGAAAVAAVVSPVAAVRLPGVLDARPTYQGQLSCDPVDKPGAVALGRLLVNTYRTGTFGVSRWCDGSQSEHAEGRAIDWMLNAADPQQSAVAASALAWMTANSGEIARRLGVQYLIFDRKMWRAYAPERGWAPYSGASPHTDHIHISLTWDGAAARTSWWTGRAVTRQDLGPCRVNIGQYAPIHTTPRTGACPAPVTAPVSPYPVYTPGQRGVDIKTAQAKLGVVPDGSFGYATRTALLAFQKRAGVPRTGVLDKATWVALMPAATNTTAPAPTPVRTPPVPVVRPVVRKLPATVVTRFSPYTKVNLAPGATGPAVRALQSGLGIRVNGSYDAATTRAVAALQKSWRLPGTGRMNLKTWNRLDLSVAPWLGYLKTTLSQGATGKAVVAAQRALGVAADGQFGSVTAAAVRAVQVRYALPTTAIIDPRTWRAVADNARR